MKKQLIIGTASVALAAMPVVGVFAATQTATINDTLSATITSACTFLRYGEAGSANQGPDSDVTPSYSGPASGAASSATATYSATFKPTSDIELGTSHFTAYCNAADGFKVTVTTPNLANGSNTIDFSGTAPDAATGEGWTLTKSDSSLVTATGATFMSASGPTDSSTDSAVTESATYKVYTNSTTKAGTYTGNVVYTFTYEDPNTP